MFRQTIITKYLGPSNVRGSRISARTTSGCRIVLDWDDSLNSEKNHWEAMATLAMKLNWANIHTAVGGTLRGGAVVWVFP